MNSGRGRRGGRAARRKLRTQAPLVMAPTLVVDVPLYEILDENGVEAIHDASMTILEGIGIDFRDDEAIALWKQAGADVDGQRVRLDRALVMELVAKAPESITMHARNPERTVEVGGRNMVFAPTYGSPFVLDLENKRRYSTLEDLYNFYRLAYMTPHMHLTGGITCEPVDVPIPRRHLHIVYGLLKYSDKPFMGATTSRERAEDSVALAKIAMGDDFVEHNTVMASVMNCNSPLLWDETMLDAVKVYAHHNQVSILSPFVLGGASTPASSVGSVAQLNAEALAGIAFSQVVRAGAPVIYGQFLAPVSMKSGAPMAGTPEICFMNYMIGQLARRYRLPWRSSGMTSGSKIVDAQAAYESIMTMHSVVLAGANYVLHSAGWLEGGLTASFAKFVLDAEHVAMFYKFAQGVDMADLDDAMAAVREVGPGSHFLGAEHTRKNFESAFFMPELLDNNSFEQWEVEGSKDTDTRGREKVREMLGAYQEPDLDPAIDEALKDFIARRETELPEGIG